VFETDILDWINQPATDRNGENIMKSDIYEQIRSDLELAILANGGFEFREDWCRCDPEVGYYPCEYCAIFRALTHFQKLLNIKQ
jgi:hypothetical protein